MKELISIIFLLSCFLTKAQNNVGGATTNIVCRYQVQFLKDTLNVESKTNEIMALQIGSNISLYKK